MFGFAQGAYAEYAATPVSTVAAIPNAIDFTTAAALPTAGSTALQIIRDVVAAKPGMSGHYSGTPSGVGSSASQIAKTCEDVIDYKRGVLKTKPLEWTR